MSCIGASCSVGFFFTSAKRSTLLFHSGRGEKTKRYNMTTTGDFVVF